MEDQARDRDIAMAERILTVDNLKIDIPVPAGMLHAVQEVSKVDRGETLCIVGESGCGKSLTSLTSWTYCQPSNPNRNSWVDNQNVLGIKEDKMANIRGNRMGMIFQEPMTSLNPAYTIGNQMEETNAPPQSQPRGGSRRGCFPFGEGGDYSSTFAASAISTPAFGRSSVSAS